MRDEGSKVISRLTCTFLTAVHSTWQKPPLATTAPRLDRGPPLLLSLLLLLQSPPPPLLERPNMAARGRQNCCRRAPKANKGQQRPTKANTIAPSTKSPIISIQQGRHDESDSQVLLLNCLTALSQDSQHDCFWIGLKIC